MSFRRLLASKFEPMAQFISTWRAFGVHMAPSLNNAKCQQFDLNPVDKVDEHMIEELERQEAEDLPSLRNQGLPPNYCEFPPHKHFGPLEWN